MAETTIQRCRAKITGLTVALASLGQQITQGLAQALTVREESLESITTPITTELGTRLQTVEDRIRDIETTIQNELLSNYTPLLQRMQELEELTSELPITGAEENELPTPERFGDSQPTPTRLVETDSVRTQPSPTPIYQPQIDTARASRECTEIDWCEPLRIYVSQIMTQLQRLIAPISINNNNQIIDRQQDRPEEGPPPRVNSPMSGSPIEAPVEDEPSESLSLIEAPSRN